MNCVCVRLYETTYVTKIHKWTSSSHGGALKLLGSQVDEFIPSGCLKIIKFTSRRVYY